MDEDVFELISRIDVELIELCRWLNTKRDSDTASRLIPIADDLTRLVAEMSVEKP